MVEQPYGENQEGKDNQGDDQSHTYTNAGSREVSNVRVTTFAGGFLPRQTGSVNRRKRWGIMQQASTDLGAKNPLHIHSLVFGWFKRVKESLKQGQKFIKGESQKGSHSNSPEEVCSERPSAYVPQKHLQRSSLSPGAR